jgi:dihydrofolate reductase
MKNKVSIISAIGVNNRVIGTKDGKIPWYIKKDFQFFKEKTIGHSIIMGRKTFESFNGRILPNRPHIILTSQKDYLDRLEIKPEFEDRRNQLFIAKNISEAVDLAKKMDSEEIFIIGGGKVYQETIALADKLYLTLINKKDNSEIEGSVFFPEYKNLFPNIISEQQDSEGEYEFKFIELEK